MHKPLLSGDLGTEELGGCRGDETPNTPHGSPLTNLEMAWLLQSPSTILPSFLFLPSQNDHFSPLCAQLGISQAQDELWIV